MTDLPPCERQEDRVQGLKMLERVWLWIQQGGNSSIVLIGVTTVYVFLTWRIMRATARQAATMLQPVLSFEQFTEIEQGIANHNNVRIENQGNQPVVFLNVERSCYPHGHKAIVKRGWFEDYVLSARASINLSFDFRTELTDIHVDESYCGYSIVIVVSDLSRQVVAEYEFMPVGRVCLMSVRLSRHYSVPKVCTTMAIAISTSSANN